MTPPNHHALHLTAAPLDSRTVQIICSRLLQPTGRFRRRSLSLIGGAHTMNSSTASNSTPRRRQRWLKVCIWTVALLVAYFSSAVYCRVMFERGAFGGIDSPIASTLEKVYAPLDALGRTCPPFTDAFEWCVHLFPLSSCKNKPGAPVPHNHQRIGKD